MHWMEVALPAAFAGLAIVPAWKAGRAAWSVMRLQLRRSKVVVVTREAIPPAQREALLAPAALLAELDFRWRCSAAFEQPIAAPGAPPLYCDIYEHTDAQAHAWVCAGFPPERGPAWSVHWITLGTDGHVLCTLNCERHEWVAIPPGWTVHDDYLPGLRQAWQRHAARVAQLEGRVVTDGLQVFRAHQGAIELLLNDCAHHGLARRDGGGDRGRLRWRAALRFAWALARGRAGWRGCAAR